MIYIYASEPMDRPNLAMLNLPGLVRNMMENPLGMLSYFYLKRTVAQSIYYIQNQYQVYLSFWNAYAVRR